MVICSRSALVITVLLALCSLSGSAQRRAELPSSVIRVKKTLVLIPVSATDTHGSFVPDLRADEFQLFENGKAQRLSSVAVEDGPISLGIVFDVSGSMAKAMPYAKDAVRQILRHCAPEDEFTLVTFRDEPSVALEHTSEAAAVLSLVEHLDPHGETALFDALLLTMARLRHAKYDRRAIVLISDGAENSSRYTRTELLRAIREAGMAFYPIHIPDGSFESDQTQQTLWALARESGGRYLLARRARDLPRIADSLEMRRFYVLSYSPENERETAKYRNISVKVIRPTPHGLSIHPSWRRGYSPLVP